MYIYAMIGGDNIVQYFWELEEPLSSEDFPDAILVDAVNETWIKRKRWNAETEEWEDVLPSESNGNNSLEFTHLDSNGTKHWLDEFVNDLAEDVAAIDPSDFAAASHTHTPASIGAATSSHTHSGYASSSHNHDSAYIKKALQIVGDSGGVKIGINVADNKNVVSEIMALSAGVYTIYSQSGVAGNPKTTEAWRMLAHKTSATIGWVIAFGSSGSVYTNYQNEADHVQGWRCIYDATNSNILWTGAYYMHSPSSTPQVVTPSKKLSECRTGWLLLWSDYDASAGTANDTDFCTTYIPKYNPSGGTWGGKAFYCDIPMYVGSDVTDISTEQRVIKPIYIHDDCIKGSYQNNQGGRNDVVLRAVYEV